MKQTYNHIEKLKHKNDISLLFEKGKWKTHQKLRLAYLPLEEEKRKIGVSVSKRYFKKAVDRNRIKRLLREVYRLNKPLFTETFGENVLAMLFWISPKKPSHYKEVETLFIRLCEKNKEMK